MKGRLIRRVPGAQIMKRSEEISDQLGIVREIVEPPNRFELAHQMKGDFAERCFDLEGAIPGAAILAIEAIAPRPCVREGGVDERVATTAEHQLAWVEAWKTRLLCLQARIGHALQAREIFKRAEVGGKRR